ncbi:MAG: hypothetical protein K9N23_07180 [Akkermansiaceae bacterium]|nr:hypothetical protein [Akkermansiaceae bacterium]MCF7731451.1 hypothetical protein [Akkermansiaceae bacterium]
MQLAACRSGPQVRENLRSEKGTYNVIHAAFTPAFRAFDLASGMRARRREPQPPLHPRHGIQFLGGFMNDRRIRRRTPPATVAIQS